MNNRTDPTEIYKEYQDGISYQEQIELSENVRKNENMYNDRQWEGVKAPDLEKPVFNFLKPVVNYYVAQIVSDDIAANLETMGDDGADPVPKIIGREIERLLETTRAAFKNRQLVRNMAVDGDMCLYCYWDPEKQYGEGLLGDIETQIIKNTDVFFGNTLSADVQSQPYLIIRQRRLLSSARREARENGEDPDLIVEDSDPEEGVRAEKYVTVLLKFYREGGAVHFTKVTRSGVIKRPTRLGYDRYPIAYASWEPVHDSCHGVSPLTGKRANQIFVNKLYAMAMEYTKNQSFPKLLYDGTKIKGWSNRVGEAIAVSGDPRTALFASFQAAGMNADVMNMVEKTVTQTKEMMGAYDAALGNVKPDNTSAIVAVQKAASMPLDLQRMNFYQFMEDVVRIWIDMMAAHYGPREVVIEGAQGERAFWIFDFSTLSPYRYKLNIEIGASSYWSELMQVQTLDNLMAQKIIPDAVTYLENIPDGYIKGKGKIIERIKQQQLEGGGNNGLSGVPGGGLPV